MSTTTPQQEDTALGRWAFRLALGAALLAIPLVIFGGSVTTLGAGLAVEGWLVAEGHFMLFLPVDTWIGDTHRFVEHVHRLFGTAVGLAAVAACVAAWIGHRRGSYTRAQATMATVALGAVIVQGAVGGQRVELFSDSLAFLHGTLAQGVLALLFTSALILSPRWRNAGSGGAGATPRGLALVAAVSVYAQIVLGAAYRHALRPDDNPGAVTLLWAHVLGALLVLLLLSLLARKLKAAAGEFILAGGDSPAQGALLALQARRIHLLVGLQVLLGFLAWMGYAPGSIAPLEWGLSVVHVLVGGLLLAQVVAAALWCARFGRFRSLAPASTGLGREVGSKA